MFTQEIISSNKSEALLPGDASFISVSSVVIQVRGNAWTGTLVIAGRVRQSGLPFRNIPYQNLETLADVAAGTAITADGLFAIRADGMELQITHTRTAGSVDIAISPLVG